MLYLNTLTRKTFKKTPRMANEHANLTLSNAFSEWQTGTCTGLPHFYLVLAHFPFTLSVNGTTFCLKSTRTTLISRHTTNICMPRLTAHSAMIPPLLWEGIYTKISSSCAITPAQARKVLPCALGPSIANQHAQDLLPSDKITYRTQLYPLCKRSHTSLVMQVIHQNDSLQLSANWEPAQMMHRNLPQTFCSVYTKHFTCYVSSDAATLMTRTSKEKHTGTSSFVLKQGPPPQN